MSHFPTAAPPVGPILPLSFDEALDRLADYRPSAQRDAVEWMDRSGQLGDDAAVLLEVIT